LKNLEFFALDLTNTLVGNMLSKEFYSQEEFIRSVVVPKVVAPKGK
jgi:hypothetical protein